MKSTSPTRAALSALALSSAALAAASQSAPDDYSKLTDSPREFTNLNIETVRGLAPALNGTLFALNTHASQIVVHSDADPEPEQLWQTLLYPVSIGLFQEQYLVVAGGGTHALALHDASNGDILNALQLDSEPADMVIDQVGQRAFVACQGDNVVVEVALPALTLTARYPIPAESPRMLFLQGSGAQARVFVAPFLSGNNSTLKTSPTPGVRTTVFDLSQPFMPQLPDDDLFVIDPSQPPAQAVTAVLKRAGTLLTAHGENPYTHQYWMLNVESLNNLPQQDTEPRARGRFALNRLTIAKPSVTPPQMEVSKYVDLDDVDPATDGGQYAASRAMGFPFALEFTSGGLAFVASPLNDRVTLLGSGGDWLGLIQLPPGSIPFDLALDRVNGTKLYTYCWGTNKVQENNLLQPGTFKTLDLGVDPAPERIRAGRKLWYDGDRSKDARFSCNTCHPGGRSDNLGWSISDDPNDPKDLMVTQSLLSIEDTFPYHWRGERDLLAFNGAFPGLLGAAAPLTTGDGSEFEAFQAFVFSLQVPANPRQDLTRKLVDDPTQVFTDHRAVMPPNTPQPTYAGLAINGQQVFLNAPTFLQRTCASCHQLPTGSRGDFVNEVGRVDAPTGKYIEVPHLRELRHKDQPVEKLTLGGVTELRSRGGFGLTHDGERPDLFDFLNQNSTFHLQPQQAADVSAFVQQFDSGLAPAAHAVFMVDEQHPNGATDVSSTLTFQADPARRWIDCVAFGSFVDPSTGQTMKGRWRHDFTTGLFQHNGTGATVTLQTIKTQASLGLARMAFLGVPPLNGIRFAWDPDNDHLLDWVETASSTDRFDPDTDDDGQQDEYELVNPGGNPTNKLVQATDGSDPGIYFPRVDFESASLAKVMLSSDEDVQLSSTFSTSTPGGVVRTFFDPVWSRDKTFSLQGLEASTPSLPWVPSGSTNAYTPTIVLTDRAGKTASVTLNSFNSKDMILPPVNGGRDTPFVLTGLSAVETRSGDTLTLSATATMRHRYRTPGATDPSVLQGWVVLAQLVVGPEPTIPPTPLPANWEYTPLGNTVALGTTTRAENISIYDALPTPSTRTFATVPGPFLITAQSNSAGVVQLDVSRSGLKAGQKVRLNILGILEPEPGMALTFRGPSLVTYQVGPTPGAKRGLAITF
jgi:hypothetical protein